MPSADWSWVDNCSGCGKRVDLHYIEIDVNKPGYKPSLNNYFPENVFIGKGYCSEACVKYYSSPTNKVVSF